MPLWDWLITWDWGTVAKSFVGAGFGTAVVTGVLSLYRDRRHRSSQAAYMAMRLAVALEFYTLACADLISNNSNAERRPNEEFPDWTFGLPELPPYPDDAEGWRAIDRKLAGRCLNLRNKIHGSQRIIGATWEHASESLGDTLDEQAAERGLEAWQLAVALRHRHGVEEVDAVGENPEYLETVLRSAQKAKKERDESNAAMIADFMSSDPER
jgi:hypothetical protein